MSEIIKVAIGGSGRSGHSIHFKTLQNLKNHFEIVALADELEERHAEAEASGARVYKDYRDMLKDGGFDMFINALPTPLHHPATVEAIEQGYHVVCEKPLARKVQEFDEMCQKAQEYGKLLAPFQQNRFQPFFTKLQEVVNSGVLGELISIRSIWNNFSRRWDWQTYQKNIGGSLYNTGPHAVDQMVTLMGDECDMPNVFCQMKSIHDFDGDAENFCSLSLYGEGLPLMEITINSFAAYDFGPRYCISGTRGSLVGGELELKWKYFSSEEAPHHEMWKPWSINRQYPSETLPWKEFNWSVENADLKNATGYTMTSLPSAPEAFYKNIHDVYHKRDKPIIGHSQVRRQLEIIEEAHRQNPLPKKI